MWRTVLVDGLSIQTTDQGAQAIEKLQNQLRDTTAIVTTRDTAISDAAKAHAKAIETKDGEAAALAATHKTALETKDGEIAALKAKVPDAAAMDNLLADREHVIGSARKILGDTFDPKGKADADIRRAAVVKALGDKQVEGKSDDYVAAAFDTLTVVQPGARRPDLVRDALRTQQPGPVNDAQSAHAQMLDRMSSAWNGVAQKGAA